MLSGITYLKEETRQSGSGSGCLVGSISRVGQLGPHNTCETSGVEMAGGKMDFLLMSVIWGTCQLKKNRKEMYVVSNGEKTA